jgi:hypothetical protein
LLRRHAWPNQALAASTAWIARRGTKRFGTPAIGIDNALDRLRYIKYWEQKKAELAAEMQGVGGEHLQGIREELDLFAKIRATMAHIVDLLGDMHTLRSNQHQGSNFGLLLQALEARLSE